MSFVFIAFLLVLSILFFFYFRGKQKAIASNENILLFLSVVQIFWFFSENEADYIVYILFIKKDHVVNSMKEKVNIAYKLVSLQTLSHKYLWIWFLKGMELCYIHGSHIHTKPHKRTGTKNKILKEKHNTKLNSKTNRMMPPHF